jgi:lysophospholipase L1-like esterase
MNLSRLKAVACAFVLGSAAFLTGAGAAHADATAGPAYVALGDSYSSGVGSGSYDSASGDCKRSALAYPELWAAANSPSSFAFTACSGATTDDVLADQLGPVNSGTGLISISIGGNDAGFSSVMSTCVLPGEDSCIDAVDTARAYVRNTLPGKLDAVYSAIRSKAPSAHVVVLGYPRFYQLDGDCVAGLTETERSAINDAADFMDSTIATAAARYGFTFANVTPAFTGHEICSGDAWLHSVTWPIDESYHPTADGQADGYLPTFSAAV